MGKSLTEIAKSVILKESNDGTPDRDAQKSTENSSTLRPGSRGPEGRFANPGSNPPDADDYEDLGPALVSPDGQDGPSKASRSMGKDKSRSSVSSVGAEPMNSLQEDEEMEIEMTEELEDFINELSEQGLSEDEILEAIEENFEVLDEEEGTSAVATSAPKRPATKSSEGASLEENEELAEQFQADRQRIMSEHVNVLLKGENLSEDFREKAETIFESAVNARVEQETTILEEAYDMAVNEAVEDIKAELTEQVNDYLNYVVENWIKENEIAIETGLRTEITEDFISGLKNLFAEHYIDIPEDKTNIVEELGSKVQELEEQLNESIKTQVDLTKQLNESRKFEALVEAFDGLTVTEAEKLRTLAEGVEFTNSEDFSKKIQTLKESYLKKETRIEGQPLDLVESADDTKVSTESLTGPMSSYVRALGKKLPN